MQWLFPGGQLRGVLCPPFLPPSPLKGAKKTGDRIVKSLNKRNNIFEIDSRRSKYSLHVLTLPL
jgi:hypothetical protein